MDRVELSLHLDPDGDAIGGGWSYYRDDDLVAMEAVPGFSPSPLTVHQASGVLLDCFILRCGAQLRAF